MSESLGKTIKKIRESRQLSLDDVSEETRISKKTLIDIEEDRLDRIRSDFYAKVFVQSYSKFLGALEDQVIKDYFSNIHKKKEKPEITPTAKPKRQYHYKEHLLRWFSMHKPKIGVGIVGLLCVWFLIFSFGQMRKFVRFISAKRKEAAAVRALEAPKEELKTEAPPQKIPEKIDGVNLEISAQYNTWIEVTSDGELLFRGILKKNEKDIWRAKDEIKLQVGNAGGVKLKLNDENLGHPGKKGEKKEIIVTKDGIGF